MNEYLRDLHVDHIRLYATDVDELVGQFARYGFDVFASGTQPTGEHSVAVGTGGIRLVVTRPADDDSPGAAYTAMHDGGVAAIALLTSDAESAYREAVRRGARPVSEPMNRDGVTMASILAFGDVIHTFVQRDAHAPWSLPGLVPDHRPGTEGVGLRSVDHFAVCVEAGRLDDVVRFYEEVMGFSVIFTERIVVGEQAMDSQVVQSESGAVTLTLIAPDPSRDPGQIDSFLKNHGGAGIQHVAFETDDVVRSVGAMNLAGVDFLQTPDTYYTLMRERLELARHSVASLRALHVLADEDHDGQLYQIFTRSTHPRGTLFFEIIERLGARTFGSGNIKALYESVELEQTTQARG